MEAQVTSQAARSRPAPSLRRDRIPLGIAFMMGATLLFAICQALSKWEVASYSFAEVLFFRAFGSLIICSILILPRRGLGVFHTQRLGAHAARNALQTTSQSLMLIALSMMPLAGAVAINFSSPLFAAVLAAICLREKIGGARAVALVVGFLGVLLVASPGASSFNMGAIFAIANAVAYGSVMTMVRGMSATESAETLTMHQMVFLTALFALALPIFGFATPKTDTDWLILFANGILNGVGQYWWTRALSLAPPAALGPYYYFLLVWAMILGFLMWGDVPTLMLIAGSAIVVGSGLFLLWHESGKKALPAD